MSRRYRSGGPAPLVFFLVALALIKPGLHLLFALCIFALIRKGMEVFFQNNPQYQPYKIFEKLAMALLCFVLSTVSGIFAFIGVIMLIQFLQEMKQNKQSGLPPLPNMNKHSSQNSFRPSHTSQSASGSSDSQNSWNQISQNASFSSSGSGENPYTNFLKEDLIQQAYHYMDDAQVDLSKLGGFIQSANANPYQKALNLLKRDIEEIDQREESVSDFLDGFFAGSTVSKTRYTQVLKNAHARLESNYQKAQQAVQLFGRSEPTKERLEILNRYVQDSAEILQKVDRVIDELITVQQNDFLSDGEVLDSLLDDLANTTSCYQRSPYKKQDNSSGSFPQGSH